MQGKNAKMRPEGAFLQFFLAQIQFFITLFLLGHDVTQLAGVVLLEAKTQKHDIYLPQVT